MNVTDVDLKELAHFLVKAKTHTYAAGGREVRPQRPGFKELEFRDGEWEYRDSYAGYYFAPGQEVVRLKSVPVWAMAYSGGMRLHALRCGEEDLTKRTFAFLKKALLKVDASRPFRGPGTFTYGHLDYVDSNSGDITDFTGREKIFYRGGEVFAQKYMGGLIIHKTVVIRPNVSSRTMRS